jgi:hypothetical protein
MIWLTAVSGWDVLRGYKRRVKIMRLTVHDHDRRSVEAARFRRAAWALRTRGQRRQVLPDLLVQPDMPCWLRSDAERKALVDALLSPVLRQPGRSL